MFTQLIGTGLIFSGITGGGGAGEDVETGTVLAYAGPTAPTGYLICDGSAVLRSTFASLFATIGTAYGSGNGTTTFNVPNLQDRFTIGKGNLVTSLGDSGGDFDHSHTTPDLSTTSDTESADSDVDDFTGGTSVPAREHTHFVSIPANFTGNANPPYLALNFIIKT